MDITNLVLSISLGTLLTIASIIISVLGYNLNKQKHNEAQAKDREAELRQAIEDAKKEDAEKQNVALQLLEIRKDLAHIRDRQEEQIGMQKDHEKRIQSLEKACRAMKRSKS